MDAILIRNPVALGATRLGGAVGTDVAVGVGLAVCGVAQTGEFLGSGSGVVTRPDVDSGADPLIDA